MNEKKFIVQKHPFRIPVPGNKLIEEHFGLATTGQNQFSLAHMIAPPHWGEPAQQPEFDEVTIMIKGQMQIKMKDETILISAGESFWVKAGEEVQYSNPFDEPSEYWAVCMPAFDIKTVNRSK